ncbi:hypothetical protein BDN72DRAFT_843544 [Pluteus cervinus]|uniref:Uncharacterized protein n=1 Tax=Pluteus cervinus TaxID=181527 RepID=A0ACD3ANE8_9AGAR|nr:hypothetical protein BDN72DRAFT_843544 [Pluteus cervinus]
MLTVLVLALAFFRVHAAPFSDNGPATDPTLAHTIFFGIQPRSNGAEANMRTLYDVVRSCVFTIAACVYRAIHQNIPDPTMTMWGRLRVKMKITIYALIAPEAMIWWALRQRYGAIDIAFKMNALNNGLKWTQTHGQFAQMGGFARKDNKHVLRPTTLIDLLKKGQLDLEELELTKEDIDDKSKGDILSKAVVASQTTWFVFECLTRLQQGLPLIELEVVTLAFAVLNIITYALWWYKPLNVLRPIYLHVLPEAPGRPPHIHSLSEAGVIPGTTEGDHERRPLVSGEAGITQEPTVEGNQVRDGRGPAARTMWSIVDQITEDVESRLWWQRLVKQTLLAVTGPFGELLIDDDIHGRAMHVSTFYGMKISDEKSNLVLRLSCFIGMIFGVIHFLSWHSTFPTPNDLFGWRVWSIVLVGQPVVILVGNLFAEISKRRQDDGSWRELITDLLHAFFVFLWWCGLTSYIAARFCILGLAFLTLNHLPPRALDSITWTFYIPHL